MRLHKVLVSSTTLEIKKLHATVTFLHCFIIVSCALFLLFLYGVFLASWDPYMTFLIILLYGATSVLTFVQDVSKFTFRPLKVQFSSLLFFMVQIVLIFTYLQFNDVLDLEVLLLVIIFATIFVFIFLFVSSRLHVLFSFDFFRCKFFLTTFLRNMRNGYTLVLFGVLEAVLFLFIRKFIQLKDGDLELGIYAVAMVVLGVGLSLFRAVLIEYEPKCYKFGQMNDDCQLSQLVSFHIFLVLATFMAAFNLSLVSGKFWIPLVLPNDAVLEVVRTIVWYSLSVFSWIACLVVYPVAIAKSDNTKSFYRLLKCVVIGVSFMTILSVWFPMRLAQLGLAISLIIYVYSELRRYSVLPGRRENREAIKVLYLNTLLFCCGQYFLNNEMATFQHVRYIAFTLTVLLANGLIIFKSQTFITNK